MLAYWTGTLFSIPFLPPIDAGVRPYAATIASLFLPICFVFSGGIFKRLDKFQNASQELPVNISYKMAFVLLLFPLLGAPLLRTITRTIYAQPVTCESGLTPVSFQLLHGSYISLSTSDEENKTKVPLVLLSDVNGSFDDFAYADFASLVRKIKQPILIAATIDIPTSKLVWVIAPTNLKADEDQVISACGDMTVATYPVVFIRTIENR